jgi:hypothetical protein
MRSKGLDQGSSNEDAWEKTDLREIERHEAGDIRAPGLGPGAGWCPSLRWGHLRGVRINST